MKIAKPLEDSSLLIKGVSQTIGNKTKKQRGEFLGMLYPKSKLNGKCVNRYWSNQSWRQFVMTLDPLNKFETLKYYQNKFKFHEKI